MPRNPVVALTPAGAATVEPEPAGRAPGPRGWDLFRSLIATRRDRLGLLLRLQREHGDLVCLRTGRRRLFLLSHPDHFHHVLVERARSYGKGPGLVEAEPLLGEGLLTSAAERAGRDRRNLHPAVGPARLAGYCPRMVRSAEAVAARWRSAAAEGRSLDVERDMVAFALEVLGSTLLGVDLRTCADSLVRDLDTVTGWAIRRMTAPLPLPGPGSLSARRALRRLRRLAARLVEERSAPGGAVDRGGDLLGLLTSPQAGLSPRQVRDHLLTFLLAGHETVAATLTWLWYALAGHPEVDRRLHEELERTLDGRTPTADDLPRLSYARAVIEETMRLHPPVWAITRQASEDDEIDGWSIPAGSDLLLGVYTLHRHPAYWRDPDRFEPGRFLDGGRGSRAYLPFGVGPRSCLGGRFALQEATIAVAVLAREFGLEAVSETPVRASPGLTLRPRHGLRLRPVVRRLGRSLAGSVAARTPRRHPAETVCPHAVRPTPAVERPGNALGKEAT